MKQLTMLEQTIKDVKREVLKHIILNLRHYELTTEEAQYLAQDLLAIFPVTTMDELFMKLNKLTKDYKEVRPVFIKYAKKYYEEQEKQVLQLVPPYIKNGEIEQAVTLMKGVNYHG